MFDLEGFIVESDAQGTGDFVFCAFFVHQGDAEDFCTLNTDEPTVYRWRPNHPAIRLVA